MNEKKDIVTGLCECIDGMLDPMESTENDFDLIDFVDKEVAELRKKYKAKPSQPLGDVSDDGDCPAGLTDDLRTLEHQIVLRSWGVIKEGLEECGMGDIVREVMAEQYFGVMADWNKRGIETTRKGVI